MTANTQATDSYPNVENVCQTVPQEPLIADVPNRRAQLVLKATHGLHGFGSGCYCTYLQLWMRLELGLPASRIGVISALCAAATTLVVPLLCALFDASKKPHNFFVAIILVDVLAHVSNSALPWLVAGTFQVLGRVLLLPWLSLAEAVHSTTYSLVDTLTLGALPDKLMYGPIRLWAGLMYSVAAVAVGFAVEMPWFNLNATFFVFGFVFLIIAVLWAWSPVPRVKKATATELPSAPSSNASNERYLSRVARVVKAADRQLAELLLIILFMGIACSCMNSFVFLWIHDLGGSTSVMGMSIALNIVTEVPIFRYSGKLITVLGPRGVLYVGVAAYALRLGWYAIAWSPWSVLIAEPLHGVTFALIWSNLATIGAKIAPVGLEATTQGVLNLVFNGLGGVTGTLAGGFLYDRSPRLMFSALGGMMLSVLPLMFLSDLCRACVARSTAGLEGIHTQVRA